MLKPWKKLTVLMSSEKYPTLSLVMPSKQTLQDSLLPREADFCIIQGVKNVMAKDLTKRYQQDNVKMLCYVLHFLIHNSKNM